VNEILSLGLILIAALMAGHLAQRIHVPEVSGYLLVGVLIGPAGFDLISHSEVRTLSVLSEIALGLILFGIGATFEAKSFRELGPGVVRVTAWETVLAFTLVAGGLMLVGQAPPLALLLGVVAMETAPATTLMVLHEYRARGPLTDRLLALVALNNMVVLVAYGLVASALLFVYQSGEPWPTLLYRAAHSLVWSTLGSIALGIVLGVIIDLWAKRARREWAEGMILSMGIVLVAVGAARALGLSPLFATLALGATMANSSHHGDYLLRALGRADPPLYAAFFVLAGAELRLDSLGTLGLAGMIFVVLRVVGKVVGARRGLRGQDVSEPVRAHLGFCLISSSSLAIGLTLQVRATFPDLADMMTGVVLAAVLIFEIVGPILTRRALIHTGEARALLRSDAA
jgi:Kef-type K+ transport system membrane component KefB